MTDPIVLRVTRPYANEDEFLAAEGWCVDDKGIVLVDQPELPKDTVLRFELLLEDGSKPVRAEGKVSRMVAPAQGRPGGLKIRFRRFDGATKKFIERAMEARKRERRSRRPPPPAELPPLSLDADPALSAEPAAEPAAAVEPAPQTARSSPPPPPSPLPSAPLAKTSPELDQDQSGVRHRRVDPIPPPPNREELLERLRERAKKLGKA